LKSYLNENGSNLAALPVVPRKLGELIRLVDEGKINFSIASSRIFPEMIKQPDVDPESIATTLNLLQSSDSDEVAQWVKEALEKMPDKVAEYRKGKKGLLGLFVGEVKKISKGKADPKLTNELLLQKLDA
jgi:aspartyl-tRNA(Asn)/glutamyl-tRNA(Gln) amidotransferase subunit B